MDEIDPEHAEGLLLVHAGRIEQVSVEDDLGGLLARAALEPDADPAPPVLVMLVAARGDRVGEREERRGLAARLVESVQQLGELVLEHVLEPPAADKPLGGTVERAAHRHVVGRDALGDGPRRAAYLEEPAGHLLPGADLGDGTVLRRVEIDRERLLSRARSGVIHAGTPPRRSGCRGSASSPSAHRLSPIRPDTGHAIEGVSERASRDWAGESGCLECRRPLTRVPISQQKVSNDPQSFPRTSRSNARIMR